MTISQSMQQVSDCKELLPFFNWTQNTSWKTWDLRCFFSALEMVLDELQQDATMNEAQENTERGMH